MKTVAIVGFGRFGKTLYRMLENNFKINIYKKDNTNVEEIYKSDVIFYCVPISEFESVIKSHRKYFRKENLLIDVLSVKIHAKKVFSKYLKNSKTQAILTHPLFGPDSSKNGFKDLPMVMDKFKSSEENFSFWKNYFMKIGLKVFEMSAEQHDKLAAQSQGVTHFLGRILKEYKFAPTEIDTLGAKKLHEVQEQTCNDTWELFLNLQNYNPYTKQMRIRLGKAYEKLYNRLLPKQVDPKNIVFGIQGGKGSFNEEALLSYVEKNNIKKFKIKYLFTTEKVLKNLHEGTIDFGLFAIQNAVGGVVQESTHAMAKYTFEIINEFTILVRHFLMKRKDVDLKDIKTIIAHPQVFKQCQTTLKEKYTQYKCVSGERNLVDTAKAAQAVSNSTLPKNYAILGPAGLAKMYDFNIVAENLQDSSNNLTSFFIVKR